MSITNAKYKGRVFLLQVETATPGTYASIGGLRTKSLAVNNEEIDISDEDDGTFKKGLEGGLQSLAVSGAGLVTNEANYKLLKAAAFANTHKNCKLTWGAGDTLTCLFHISSLAETGAYNGAQEFTVSLVSADTPTFTPAA